jgi:hypothetical protein
MSEETKQFNEWALVELFELFGHQKIVGKVTEATLAGGAFIRVDVPSFNGAPAFTRYFGPSAIYSLNPITEEVARGLMERYRNEPVSRFELPQIADKVVPQHAQSHDDFNDPDDDDPYERDDEP